MNTPSPIVTPQQMNVWLWTLQRAPITAPPWISTNVPICVPSPIRQPYRFVKDRTITSAPRSTSLSRRKGAALHGLTATRRRYAAAAADGSSLWT
jgi:hypothetical protein